MLRLRQQKDRGTVLPLPPPSSPSPFRSPSEASPSVSPTPTETPLYARFARAHTLEASTHSQSSYGTSTSSLLAHSSSSPSLLRAHATEANTWRRGSEDQSTIASVLTEAKLDSGSDLTSGSTGFPPGVMPPRTASSTSNVTKISPSISAPLPLSKRDSLPPPPIPSKGVGSASATVVVLPTKSRGHGLPPGATPPQVAKQSSTGPPPPPSPDKPKHIKKVSSPPPAPSVERTSSIRLVGDSGSDAKDTPWWETPAASGLLAGSDSGKAWYEDPPRPAVSSPKTEVKMSKIERSGSEAPPPPSKETLSTPSMGSPRLQVASPTSPVPSGIPAAVTPRSGPPSPTKMRSSTPIVNPNSLPEPNDPPPPPPHSHLVEQQRQPPVAVLPEEDATEAARYPAPVPSYSHPRDSRSFVVTSRPATSPTSPTLHSPVIPQPAPPAPASPSHNAPPVSSLPPPQQEPQPPSLNPPVRRASMIPAPAPIPLPGSGGGMSIPAPAATTTLPAPEAPAKTAPSVLAPPPTENAAKLAKRVAGPPPVAAKNKSGGFLSKAGSFLGRRSSSATIKDQRSTSPTKQEKKDAAKAAKEAKRRSVTSPPPRAPSALDRPSHDQRPHPVSPPQQAQPPHPILMRPETAPQHGQGQAQTHLTGAAGREPSMQPMPQSLSYVQDPQHPPHIHPRHQSQLPPGASPPVLEPHQQQMNSGMTGPVPPFAAAGALPYPSPPEQHPLSPRVNLQHQLPQHQQNQHVAFPPPLAGRHATNFPPANAMGISNVDVGLNPAPSSRMAGLAEEDTTLPTPPSSADGHRERGQESPALSSAPTMMIEEQHPQYRRSLEQQHHHHHQQLQQLPQHPLPQRQATVGFAPLPTPRVQQIYSPPTAVNFSGQGSAAAGHPPHHRQASLPSQMPPSRSVQPNDKREPRVAKKLSKRPTGIGPRSPPPAHANAQLDAPSPTQQFSQQHRVPPQNISEPPQQLPNPQPQHPQSARPQQQLYPSHPPQYPPQQQQQHSRPSLDGQNVNNQNSWGSQHQPGFQKPNTARESLSRGENEVRSGGVASPPPTSINSLHWGQPPQYNNGNSQQHLQPPPPGRGSAPGSRPGSGNGSPQGRTPSSPSLVSVPGDGGGGGVSPAPSHTASYTSLSSSFYVADIPAGPPFYPLKTHISDPVLLEALFALLDYRECMRVVCVSRQIGSMVQGTPDLREIMLERWLSPVGYIRWCWERPEKISLSIRDLNGYMRAVSTPSHEYSRTAKAFLVSSSPAADLNAIHALAACTRAYTRVVLRLRAQAYAMEEAEEHTRQFSSPLSPSFSQNVQNGSPHSSLVHGFGGHSRTGTSTSMASSGFSSARRFKSPLYHVGYAPLLQVFVPSPQGDWLSDQSVQDCERELKIAGVAEMLKVGDIVWDVAAGDEGNTGRLLWDGAYLIDLDYTFSRLGDVPPYVHSLAFKPSYWYRAIRILGNPIVYMDLRPWAEEILRNVQLVQDRIPVRTPQGGQHLVVRWVNRSSFTIRPPGSDHASRRASYQSLPGARGIPVPPAARPMVQSGPAPRIPIPQTRLFLDVEWYGTIVLEVEGTNEGLADLHMRCGRAPVRGGHPGMQSRPGQAMDPTRIFRILRERSKAGEIWVQAVGEKERFAWRNPATP